MNRNRRTRRIPPAAWFILSALLLAGCAAEPGFEDIGVRRTAELLAANRYNPDFAVIDVRSPREFAAGRIPGAVNISIHDPAFRDRLEELDREAAYLVYCRTGIRSRSAGRVLGELGFREVYHLRPGIRGWQAEEREVER